MRPGNPSYGNDSESLQADVMRFMAIIAFCLIAILALVKNAEPALPPEADTPPPGKEPVAALEPPPAPLPPPAPPRKEPAVPPEPQPEPSVVVAATPPQAEPARVERPPVAPPAVPERARPAATADVATDEVSEEATEEEGLILRFASDGDFLRLIARGDITVYAYQDQDVLSLDRSYRFLESRSPGQVYELFRGSIPEVVVNALRQARPDIHGYRWGISLPRRISGQIRRHLDRVSRGQLVINRYGEVRHVAAS